MGGSTLSEHMHSKALVLGGGGVTGIAWVTGLLFGLEQGGVDLGSAGLVIGTSAGAAVGAQLASEVPLSDLYERQADPAKQVGEIRPKIRYVRIAARLIPAFFVRKDTRRLRARIGAMALAMETVEPSIRREVIANRLPRHDWPTMPLTVAAIEASTGEERWFDAQSGVSLVDAVGASCAVPGVWLPVRIHGRYYYDGGIPSPDNCHRARGFGAVLVVSPLGASRSGGLTRRIQGEVAELEREGSRVTLLTPDDASRVAIGRQPLDPTNRPPAAAAGLEQGKRDAASVRATWG